jgi:hypothetical protein
LSEQLSGRVRCVRADPALVDRLDRHRVEVVEAFAALPDAHHQSRALEDAEVQHDRAAVELRKPAQAAGGQRAQRSSSQIACGRVGQRLEHGIEIVIG